MGKLKEFPEELKNLYHAIVNFNKKEIISSIDGLLYLLSLCLFDAIMFSVCIYVYVTLYSII